MLTDPGSRTRSWVTFLIIALSWAFQTPMSLLIGTFLAGRQRYRGCLAVLFFIPLLLSSAALAITYKALLDPNFGLGTGPRHPVPVPGLAGPADRSRSACWCSWCPGSTSRSTR